MTHKPYSYKSTVLALLALTTSAWAQAACYTVYNSKNEVIYRSAQSPVDLSRPLHETQGQLPAGSHLVFTPADAVCVAEVNELPGARSQRANNANSVTDQLKLGSMITAN